MAGNRTGWKKFREECLCSVSAEDEMLVEFKVEIFRDSPV